MTTDTNVEPMTSSEAAAFAPTWGSMMTSGDPGAYMYGFSNGDGRPQSEKHRQACISYMEANLATVKADPDRFDTSDDEEYGETPAQVIEDIERFLAWMRTAPIIGDNEEPMTIDPTIEFQNENLCTITYGDVLKAIEATDSDPFTMSIVDDAEWAAIAQCVNQGIDSRLEAITNAHDEFDNGSCSVTPANLCVLLRRLGETEFKPDDRFEDDMTSDHESTADVIYDAASSLLGSILMVLGFNDCGKYVGREEMGLE